MDFMREALEQLPMMSFEIPDDIVFVRIDPSTGLLASDQAEQDTVEIFMKGTEPTQSAPHRIAPTDFYRLDQVLDGQAAAPGSQH
jgi:penicillin-binding protein 1A